MAELMCCSSLKSAVFPILAQVVEVQLHLVRNWTGCICAPEAHSAIWSVVEESWLIFVRPHCKPIYLPRVGLGTHQEPVETEPHIGAFTYIHEPTRSILQFLSAGSHMHRPPGSLTANLKECPDMGSVMKFVIGHVSLIQIPVHDGRPPPVVVPNLFPGLACFAAEGREPIFVRLPQGNVLDWIPEVAAQILIAKEAPVFVRSK